MSHNGDKIFMALSTFGVAGPEPMELLRGSGYAFALHETGKRITPEELLRDATDASVILAGVEPYTEEVLAGLPALRCISRCGVGVDAIDKEAARKRGITVANTPDIPTQAVAELALAMFLALGRNFIPQVASMRARRWERLEQHLLSGRVVGLLGLGRIGRKVAELCAAFGARVLAHDPNVTQCPGVTIVSKAELLRESDLLSIHASRSKEGTVLMGAAEIAEMKTGAVLVNLARGDMVDETALVEALQSGRLAGAGLDVFETEPYSGPLCDLENVILTPHSATNTIETRRAMETQCVENALAFLNGDLDDRCRVV